VIQKFEKIEFLTNVLFVIKWHKKAGLDLACENTQIINYLSQPSDLREPLPGKYEIL